MAVLGTEEADLYDCPEGYGEDDGGLVEAAQPRYRRVVSDLRRQILAGDPAPRGTLDGQSRLAEAHGVDPAIVNRALAQLSAEGLVRVEHGKRTRVLERSLWVVEFRFPFESARRSAGIDAAFTAAVAAHPAVRSPGMFEKDGTVAVWFSVESADLGGALTVAVPVARISGVNLAGASVSARPA